MKPVKVTNLAASLRDGLGLGLGCVSRLRTAGSRGVVHRIIIDCDGQSELQVRRQLQLSGD